MTPEAAAEYARELYASHPAAVPLLLAAVHGSDDVTRRRSSRALYELDPDTAWRPPAPAPGPTSPTNPLGHWRGGPLDGPARAIVDLVLMGVYCTRLQIRERATRLLTHVCAEAAAIAAAARECA